MASFADHQMRTTYLHWEPLHGLSFKRPSGQLSHTTIETFIWQGESSTNMAMLLRLHSRPLGSRFICASFTSRQLSVQAQEDEFKLSYCDGERTGKNLVIEKRDLLILTASSFVFVFFLRNCGLCSLHLPPGQCWNTGIESDAKWMTVDYLKTCKKPKKCLEFRRLHKIELSLLKALWHFTSKTTIRWDRYLGQL